MKTKIMRRPYAAPNAELICLAPSAPIATAPKKNWEWGGSGSDKWKNNSWGVSFDLLKDASATGLMDWAKEEEEELD